MKREGTDGRPWAVVDDEGEIDPVHCWYRSTAKQVRDALEGDRGALQQGFRFRVVKRK